MLELKFARPAILMQQNPSPSMTEILAAAALIELPQREGARARLHRLSSGGYAAGGIADDLHQSLLQHERLLQPAGDQTMIALEQQFHRADQFLLGITLHLRQSFI